jgi:type I restriction-modification system DNA methylase subunit
MLIKGEKDINIVYGSSLANDGFMGKEFDFMLTNPPYGKSWKKDEDAIVSERGKKGKEIRVLILYYADNQRYKNKLLFVYFCVNQNNNNKQERSLKCS